MSEQKGRGCLKNGCFGCLGVAGLLVVVALVFGLIQLVAARRPIDQVVEEKSRPLPALPIATAAQLEDAGGVVLPTAPSAEQEPPAFASGTLDLDLQIGEFTMVPGEPGSDVEIDAEYDRSRFRLVEELEEDSNGDWTYRVRLSPRLGFLGGVSNDHNRLEIRVPRGRPISIVGRVRMGQSDLELGGLWLERVDLEATMGQHTVRFDEPTELPLHDFRLRGQMGQIEVANLGNASPREIALSHRMGEMNVDLEGDWRGDGELSLRCQMGECSLDAPEGVRVIADRAAVMMGGKSVRLPDPSSLPEDAPTLRLDLRGSMGELRVR